MQQLPSFDTDIATKRKAAEDAGEVTLDFFCVELLVLLGRLHGLCDLM